MSKRLDGSRGGDGNRSRTSRHVCIKRHSTSALVGKRVHDGWSVERVANGLSDHSGKLRLHNFRAIASSRNGNHHRNLNRIVKTVGIERSLQYTGIHILRFDCLHLRVSYIYVIGKVGIFLRRWKCRDYKRMRNETNSTPIMHTLFVVRRSFHFKFKFAKE